MKATLYHNSQGNELLDKIASYTMSYPASGETVADLDWADDDSDVLCLNDIEEDFGFDFTDDQLEAIFDGQVKVAELCDIEMQKQAKITSQRDRARMRMYRMRNKAKLKRKQKIRKRKIQAGSHRRKKRIGTAAGGYSFIEQGSGNMPSGSRGSSVKMTSVPSSGTDFNPNKNTHSTSRPKGLDKVAEKRILALGMEAYVKNSFDKRAALEMARSDMNTLRAVTQEAQDMGYSYEESVKIAMAVGEQIRNPENPISGKLGYPPKPPKQKQLKIEKPKTPKPKLDSAKTKNTIPDNKVNTKPKFNDS